MFLPGSAQLNFTATREKTKEDSMHESKATAPHVLFSMTLTQYY
uniref:Uncharacterized protein n=1 Tax=Anguilla anguilla TaxID=7936 RepID=A0A0E9TBW8_ANGAN